MSTVRKIGDATFSAIGFGAVGFATPWYGEMGSEEEQLAILDAAHAAGCTFWDTAQAYGVSEELIGKWFKRTKKRADIFLCTKFGFKGEGWELDGSPENVRAASESSLKKLGVETIDLYYLHRADFNTPIEVTVRAMAELVKEGIVRYLGLSDVSEETLRRAHAVHPIAALQVEYSPLTIDIEDPEINLLNTARELGVKIVAYSPLGHGLLTGRYKSPDDFDANDFRRTVPRYSAANFPNVLNLAYGLREIGEKYGGATAGQVALAWLLAQGEDIIPIPGTKRTKYLRENIAAREILLTPEDVQAVRDAATKADATKGGQRYPEAMWALMFADTPPLAA